MAQPAHYVAHWVNTRLAQLKYITGTTGTLGQHNIGGIKDIMALNHIWPKMHDFYNMIRGDEQKQ